MIAILSAVLSEGLDAVEAACCEACTAKLASADVILNILARRREPLPPPPIATPASLKLTHAPVADCARYERLRETRRGTP